MLQLTTYNCVFNVLLDKGETGKTCSEDWGPYVKTFPARKSAVIINMFCYSRNGNSSYRHNMNVLANTHTHIYIYVCVCHYYKH